MNEGKPWWGQGAGLGGARQSLIGGPGGWSAPCCLTSLKSLSSSLPEFWKVPW